MIKLVTLDQYHINPQHVSHIEPGAHAVRVFMVGRESPVTIRVPLADIITALTTTEEEEMI